MIVQIQPWIDRDDAEAVRLAVESTFVTEHRRTEEFEGLLRDVTGARHVVAYANGTCALFAVLRASGVGSNDEVIVPDLTFAATANAVILAGATPVFCDVERDTMMMDPACAAELVSPRTKALLPVHLYGMAADLGPLLDLAKSRSLIVVEDAAQGLGVRRDGRHTGTGGAAGVLSFYGNKTITTGEGAAILTDDAELADACYRLKNHGRLEKGVFIHEEVGFNFSFTDLQAALGVTQLRKLDRVIADKARIRERYRTRLEPLDWLKLHQPPENVSPVYWFTNVLCGNAGGLSDALAENDIETRRFFYPLHMQPCYRSLNPAACPVSRQLFESGLSLPSWCGLQDEIIDDICDCVVGFGVPV